MRYATVAIWSRAILRSVNDDVSMSAALKLREQAQDISLDATEWGVILREMEDLKATQCSQGLANDARYPVPGKAALLVP